MQSASNADDPNFCVAFRAIFAKASAISDDILVVNVILWSLIIKTRNSIACARRELLSKESLNIPRIGGMHSQQSSPFFVISFPTARFCIVLTAQESISRLALFRHNIPTIGCTPPFSTISCFTLSLPNDRLFKHLIAGPYNSSE